MKNILRSLLVVGVVGAVVVAATSAFFSDTETSTGNTFAAGTIDLQVSNDSWYNGEPREDLSWEMTNLTVERFFNYEDLKPGDWGEDTIGIEVGSNPAWVCAHTDVSSNLDNGITEPEDEEDGEIDGSDGTPDGDLADELNFVFWADDGDNVFEDDEEILVEGPASNVIDGGTLTLADSAENNIGGTDGEGVSAEETFFIGKAWCYGNLDTSNPLVQDNVNDARNPGSVDGPGVDCDGTDVSNISQSDILTGDVSFYAEQTRNNDDFVCADVVWPEPKVVLGTETGDGFAPLDRGVDSENIWQAIGRFGDNLTAGAYEIALKEDSSTVLDQDGFVWTSGETEVFELTYDHTTGTAEWTIDGTTVTANVIAGNGDGDIGITAKAPKDGTVVVEDVMLDGSSAGMVTANDTAAGDDKEYLLITGGVLSDGFTLTGKVTFTWSGTTANERPAFDIEVERS